MADVLLMATVFGFGCMRLPMKDGEVDTVKFSEMVDTFLENGFNYFDTAHGYVNGKSKTVCPQHLPIRKLLAEVAGEFE